MRLQYLKSICKEPWINDSKINSKINFLKFIEIAWTDRKLLESFSVFI